MEKVANWRENVAEEMATAKETALKNERAALLASSSKHEVLEGAHGETIDRTTTVKEISFDHAPAPRHLHRHTSSSRHHHHHHHHPHHSHLSHQGLVSREPSLASGQSYRSAGARTSLVVHPPSTSSLRDRLVGMGARTSSDEWVEDPRCPGGGVGRRHLIGGGDVGVNGEVRRTSEGKGWK